MKLKAYDSSLHFGQLVRWYAIRDQDCPPEWSIPDTGVIVEGVAAGFFILMSNNCGMFDFFISNPLSDKRERDKALDKIVTELIEIARDVNCRAILCNSEHPAIKARAMKHGFNFIGDFSCFSREI